MTEYKVEYLTVAGLRKKVPEDWLPEACWDTIEGNGWHVTINGVFRPCPYATREEAEAARNLHCLPCV